MVLRIFVLVVVSLSFCSCRVYLPSLERFAIESSGSRIHSKVRYEGVLALGDRPGTWHHDAMYRILTEVKGIPEENVITMSDFLYAYNGGDHGWYNGGLLSLFYTEYADLRPQIRVVCIPIFPVVFGSDRSSDSSMLMRVVFFLSLPLVIRVRVSPWMLQSL